MRIDWDALGKIDILFGVVGGVVFVFSVLRWIGQRVKLRPAMKLFVWSVIGDDNEQALLKNLMGFAKLSFAGMVWLVIGAILGATFVITLSLTMLGIGSQVSGTTNAIKQYAILGAVVGALFRMFVWPLFSSIRNYYQKREASYTAKHDDFLKQKQRVESRIKRGRSDD
jgi:hypothetical protein